MMNAKFTRKVRPHSLCAWAIHIRDINPVDYRIGRTSASERLDKSFFGEKVMRWLTPP